MMVRQQRAKAFAEQGSAEDTTESDQRSYECAHYLPPCLMVVHDLGLVHLLVNQILQSSCDVNVTGRSHVEVRDHHQDSVCIDDYRENSCMELNAERNSLSGSRSLQAHSGGMEEDSRYYGPDKNSDYRAHLSLRRLHFITSIRWYQEPRSMRCLPKLRLQGLLRQAAFWLWPRLSCFVIENTLFRPVKLFHQLSVTCGSGFDVCKLRLSSLRQTA